MAFAGGRRSPIGKRSAHQVIERIVGYIISVKPEGQDALFAEVKRRILKGQYEEFEVLGDDKILQGYWWINEIPLNKSHPDLLVNFLDYWEIRDGKEFNFSWVTEIKLTAKNVSLVMEGSRSRWHIENQVFNTLKNQDYRLANDYPYIINELSVNQIV
ncbi:MAG: hypothetical protein H6973_03785 [Gammaproteobacteria bacterium]|nr:hypothetical protein [Gammaproteobacteria bacterium]